MGALIDLSNSWKSFHRLRAAVTALTSLILAPLQRSASAAGNEFTINHTNAPAMDGVTATSGGFGSGVWTTVDITPLITGNGTYNIALTKTSGTAFSLASREAGANAPQLIVETSPQKYH
ncbi:MAG TPA: hypothetical protein VIR02_00845 [Anaerolineales bacterium]